MKKQPISRKHPSVGIVVTAGVLGIVVALCCVFWPASAVTAQSTCVTPPSGLVSWWPADGHIFDLQDGNHGTLSGNPSFVAGKVAQGFGFDGIDDYLRISAAANLNVGNSTGFTMDAWIRPDDNAARPIFEYNNTTGAWGVHFWSNYPNAGALYANIVDTGGVGHTIQTASGILTVGAFQHVALTYDRTAGVARLYINGTERANSNLGVFTPLTTYPLFLGHRASGCCGGAYFKGVIDEADLFSRVLSLSEIQGIYNAGSAGECKPVTATIDSKASFLLANSDIPAAPTIVNLAAAGFAPGDAIKLTFAMQGFSFFGCSGPFATISQIGINGVFSNSTTLLPPSNQFRVPGAIEAGTDYVTAPTFYGNLTTDIPQDFLIVPSTGVVVQIPAGATHLFLGVVDSYYQDNCGNLICFVERVNRAPVAACQNVTVSAGASCTASASIDNGSSDPDGEAITLSQLPAGPYPLGTTTVTLAVSDGKGGSSQCSAIVTVRDTTPPQITTRPPDASYQCFSQVPTGSPSQATAADNCSTATINVVDVSNGGAGSVASPLIITRLFTATDAAGNVGSATQTITVIDDTPPTIVPPPPVSVSTGAGATTCGAVVSDAALGAAVASDNCGSAAVTRSGVPAGNFFPVGVTTIRYVATDASGNSASATQTVTVSDTTPPVPDQVALPDVVGQCSAAISAPPTATDNCRESVTGATGDPLSYTSQGTFIVTWTFNDGAGNTSTQTQRVIVHDTTAPTITTSNKTVSTDPDLCSATVAHGTTASDNCALANLVGVRSDGAALTAPYPKGTTTINWTATDQAGNTATAAETITVMDAQAPVFVSCPSDLTVAGNLSGSCSANINLTVPTAIDNCGATVSGSRSDGQPLAAPYPLGTTTIIWLATDAAGNRTSCQQQVIVTNPNPAVTITGPATGSVYAVNTPVSFTGGFTDNPGGTHNAVWTFDTLSQTGVVDESTGAVTGSYTFTGAGVYKVTLTVTDGCGGTGMASTVDELDLLIVVYDPNGGWVTGGGWITSPAGAYVANPALTGKANFGFVSKYQNGATVPTGNTEFQFKAGNLNFSSTSYEWLVIAGKKAQYKGLGTINGSGSYRFILTAIDGDLTGGGGPDKFRIKIWSDGSGLVYDNQLNAPDSDDPTTALGGGSIVIHK